MKVEFDKSFEKSLGRINDQRLLERVEGAILKAEEASSLEELSNVKKLIGFSAFYRMKIGDYRLGFEKIDEQTIRFIIICHRKDIYKKFP